MLMNNYKIKQTRSKRKKKKKKKKKKTLLLNIVMHLSSESKTFICRRHVTQSRKKIITSNY